MTVDDDDENDEHDNDPRWTAGQGGHYDDENNEHDDDDIWSAVHKGWGGGKSLAVSAGLDLIIDHGLEFIIVTIIIIVIIIIIDLLHGK